MEKGGKVNGDYCYFSKDGSVRKEVENKIVNIDVRIGCLIKIYGNVDFDEYFPDTSYLASDKSWCYINQYLMEIVKIVKTLDENIYCGKVIAIL